MKKSYQIEWIETLSKLTDTQLMKLTWTRAILGGETSFMAWNTNDDQDVLVDMPDTHTLRQFLTAVVLELLWRCEQQPDKGYGNLLVLDIIFAEQESERIAARKDYEKRRQVEIDIAMREK